MIFRRTHAGLTLIELIVVSLIIAILASITVVTVTGMVTRARVAATYGTIRAMEVAADRYKIEFDQFPMSSTGSDFGTGSTPNPAVPGNGNGYYLLGVLHTLSGDGGDPLHADFLGAMLDVETRQLGDIDDLDASWGQLSVIPTFTAASSAATQQLLDPWGCPYRYVRHGPTEGAIDDYLTFSGTQFPASSPFASTTESYYNYQRFQIISLGPNGTTYETLYALGLETDDITNFGGGL